VPAPPNPAPPTLASTPLPPVAAPPSERALTEPVPARPPDPAPPVPRVPPAESKPVPSAERSTKPAPRESAPARPGPEGDSVTLPQAEAAFLNNPKPKYPAASRRLGEQGKVLLEVLILTDGTVGEIGVKRSSGYPRLDQAALEAVRRWHFQPARRGTTPIAFRYELTLDFTIGS